MELKPWMAEVIKKELNVKNVIEHASEQEFNRAIGTEDSKDNILRIQIVGADGKKISIGDTVRCKDGESIVELGVLRKGSYVINGVHHYGVYIDNKEIIEALDLPNRSNLITITNGTTN